MVAWVRFGFSGFELEVLTVLNLRAATYDVARAYQPRMGGDVRQLLLARRYREALEELLDAHEQQVFRMALVMLRNRGRAEEVTQDVFLKLWKALPSYDGRALPSTWLYSIARNTCLSALRAESYRRTIGLDEADAPGVMDPVSDSSRAVTAEAAARRPAAGHHPFLLGRQERQRSGRHPRDARRDGEKPAASRAARSW